MKNAAFRPQRRALSFVYLLKVSDINEVAAPGFRATRWLR